MRISSPLAPIRVLSNRKRRLFKESVWGHMPSLRCLCRSWYRRYAARVNFPLYPGLAPRSNVVAAAARLVRVEIQTFAPPEFSGSSYDTDTRETQIFSPLYPAL